MVAQGPGVNTDVPAATTVLQDVLDGYMTDTWFKGKHLRSLNRHADGTWRNDDKVVVPNSTGWTQDAHSA
jgi:hypothetical protein